MPHQTAPTPQGQDAGHTGDYGGETYFAVCVFEFRDGRIARETRYYAEPFPAPEWRAQWAQPMG